MPTKDEIADLKARIDCRDLIERDIGPPKRRGSSVAAWPCPLHQGRDPNFKVTASSWKCWSQCDTSGDAIAWVMRWRGLSFIQAYEWLRAEYLTGAAQPLQQECIQRPPTATAEPPSAAWQTKAWQIVEHAEQTLWSDVGQRALGYLRGRGLLDETIKAARLGYVPGPPWHGEHIGGHKRAGLWIPHGITLPRWTDGALWGIKVRRAAGKPKYIQVQGSSNYGLYWFDEVQPGLPVLLTEGEFDALIVWQAARDIIGPVSLGGSKNPLSPRWMGKLLGAPVILARMDTDEAGRLADKRLQALSGRIHPITVPGVKDITDFYLALQHGVSEQAPYLLQRWLRGSLKRKGPFVDDVLLDALDHTP